MKKIISSAILLLIFVKVGMAQAIYQPYSFQFYQKFDEELYSTKTRLHTALKSYIIDSALQHKYDSLMNYGVDTSTHHGWVYRKVFNEHLFDIKAKDFTFFGDFMPDMVVGRDFSGHKTTWINTRAYQLGGIVGKNFYFYSSGSENQAVFPEYLDTYINQIGIVPGRAYDRSYAKRTKDWSDVSAIVSYTPVKYLNITLGHDKTFIGDGYRSVLLSDYASNYPFLKLTANLGNVRYMAMWAYMTDPPSPLQNYTNGYNNKWGIFHYLDWNVSNRLTLGFFDAIIAADRDSVTNAHRGLDPSYLNPIIFLRPVEASNGSPDNAFIGFTGKYKITDGITAYGQFALDEFRSVDFFSGKGSFRNKYSWQLGFKGANLFNVKNLNYLAEYNGALPYTYSETQEIKNYSEQGEPLAHPFGANFKELVGLLNYSYKRFDFSGEVDYGHYGLDINGLNYGKDIFKLYNNPAREYGNYIGQGLTTNMAYVEGKVAYVLNPKYNLRVELGGVYRLESNAQFRDKTSMVTIGLRSSFRQIYNDIASYRVH